jgi:hypothetical protein
VAEAIRSDGSHLKNIRGSGSNSNQEINPGPSRCQQTAAPSGGSTPVGVIVNHSKILDVAILFLWPVVVVVIALVIVATVASEFFDGAAKEVK